MSFLLSSVFMHFYESTQQKRTCTHIFLATVTMELSVTRTEPSQVSTLKYLSLASCDSVTLLLWLLHMEKLTLLHGGKKQLIIFLKMRKVLCQVSKEVYSLLKNWKTPLFLLCYFCFICLIDRFIKRENKRCRSMQKANTVYNALGRSQSLNPGSPLPPRHDCRISTFFNKAVQPKMEEITQDCIPFHWGCWWQFPWSGKAQIRTVVT